MHVLWVLSLSSVWSVCQSASLQDMKKMRTVPTISGEEESRLLDSLVGTGVSTDPPDDDDDFVTLGRIAERVDTTEQLISLCIAASVVFTLWLTFV